VEIDAVPECLNDGDNPRLDGRSGHGLKIKKNRSDGTAAKIPQELALELEKQPEHLRDREDDLAVRNVEEERLPHPLAPLLQPLGVAGRTESPCLAGEGQEMFRPAARAPNPGKPAAGIAAVEVLFDDLFDDRTEKAIFALKTLLIFRQEALEMMEQHPVEDGLLWMTRTVEPGHIVNEESRNAPGIGKGKNPGKAPRNRKKSASESG
jgi:hypothetical protein